MNAPAKFSGALSQNSRFVEPDPTEDEISLNHIEDVIWLHRLRLHREPGFAADLSAAMSECMRLLGSRMSVDGNKTLSSTVPETLLTVSAEKKIRLSAELFEVAKKGRNAHSPNTALATLLAGWLKACAIGELGEETMRRAAYQLKRDHELFFERLITERRPAS